MELFLEGFLNSEYMPHGYCYGWQPLILWMSVLSDLAIFGAYFSIPIALIFIVRKREDLRFKGIFVLFAMFILFCGITHLVSIYTIWHGTYGFHALTKFATAIVSVATSVVLFCNIDKALAIPSMRDHKRAIEEAAEERIKRTELEYEKRSEALFKFTTQMVPTGLLVIGEDQTIRLLNQAAEEMFGYDRDELIGHPLKTLLDEDLRSRHDILVQSFIDSPSKSHAMAAGRVVTGRRKDGSPVSVEIHIAINEFEGERFAFANITNISQLELERGELIESSYRVKRAIEATNDGIWEWNIQTGEVWYSPRLMTMIGQDSFAEPRYELWWEHIHPDDRERVQQSLDAHFDQRKRFDLAYRGKTSSGRYEWMHTRGDTLFDKEGKPKLMSGTLTNIHQLRTLQEELQEKTRFLDKVLERSLTGLYIFDLETLGNTYVNPEYTRITGYTLEDLSEIQEMTGLLPLFHPDDLPSIQRHFDEVVNQLDKDGVGIEYRFKHKQGHWIWCYSRDSVYSYREDGKAREMLGAFFDITDIKTRETEMRRLAVNFASTFEQAAVGMAFIDLDGRFMKVNTKLCQILGFDEQALIDLPLESIAVADKQESESDSPGLQLSSLLSGQTQQLEVEQRLLRQDGAEIWAHMTIALVVNNVGGKSHYISVIEDISERKRMELDLASSNASLERFAYSASHDLQEPLRKISSFAGLLEERLQDKLDDRDARFQLNRISDAAKRMGEMIQSLLELSRYSRTKFVKERLVLSAMVDQVKDDLSQKIHVSKASITLLNDGIVFAEANSFQQVLRNLILNSIQYTRPGEIPAISLDFSESEKHTIIRVMDEGRGFTHEQAEHLFEPFRRFVGREVAGAGMGLAICRQIVVSHGGRITAAPKDVGAIFSIELEKEDKASEH